ncbi:hypothetical protein CFP65_1284 [Kitasatospora sp. MMS16-BH015]|uniref:hypothetical protein n=1 Tax=Kitasatospora sp. MMS16-BH015 TaxID=2018025 RepID=UPI000CA10522|nr:hypothetical protein [Kitasatospora sp. MMS16-BH015]AUG76185.1 hypothetical protein CFP65_1284 [Kitasatospora sp. MMS16-BH015]
MPISRPRRRTVLLAGTAGFAAVLALGACNAPDTPTPKPTPSASATPSPSPTHSASPTPSPSPTPTTAAPTPKPTPTHTPPPSLPPAPTAPPAAPRTPAQAPAAADPTCSIRTGSGNCYHAGEFCRKGDLGKSTTDAAGREITCGIESGKPHWHY